MRRYETIFIIRPNTNEEAINAILDRAASIIEKDEGSVIRLDKWGLKKLAYLIKKENQGYYVHLDYAGLPSTVAEMERIFKIEDNVLKYLTVKLADKCDPEALKQELADSEKAAGESEEQPASEEKAEAAG